MADLMAKLNHLYSQRIQQLGDQHFSRCPNRLLAWYPQSNTWEFSTRRFEHFCLTDPEDLAMYIYLDALTGKPINREPPIPIPKEDPWLR